MDWMTLSITAIGAAIFCLWVIIPIQEYRGIYQRFREKRLNASGERETPQ